MTKTMVFGRRNSKEMLRDPLNLSFGIGFPVAVLLLFSAIQANIPVSIFEIQNITPGIVVFGLSFISMFSGVLIAKDRSSSFLMRLFASPLPASGFILGYTLPLLPMALAQMAVCFIAAFFLGLPITANVLLAVVVLLPAAVLYIGLGLLLGTVLNDKQVAGVCGGLLTNLSAWLSGAWFDLSMVGGAFQAVAYALPFAHANDAGKAALTGDYGAILPHLWWVMGYAAAAMLAAVLVFRAKMRSEKV